MKIKNDPTDDETNYQNWKLEHFMAQPECPDKDHTHCAFMCGLALGRRGKVGTWALTREYFREVYARGKTK